MKKIVLIVLFTFYQFSMFAQSAIQKQYFLIEIWSDVVCPFCYLGKKNMETAINELPFKDEIKIVWKSFELNPAIKTDTSTNVSQYLSVTKRISLHDVEMMQKNLVQMGAKAGIKYNFNKTMIINSLNAHRLIKIAESFNKSTQAKELLFKAHFEEGKNIDNLDELYKIGISLNIPEETLKNQLYNSALFVSEIREDEEEARLLSIQGVPYFLLDRKYSIYGAQETDTFKKKIEKAYLEWKNKK